MLNDIMIIIILPFVLYAMVMLSPPVLIYRLIKWMIKKEVASYYEND